MTQEESKEISWKRAILEVGLPIIAVAALSSWVIALYIDNQRLQEIEALFYQDQSDVRYGDIAGFLDDWCKSENPVYPYHYGTIDFSEAYGLMIRCAYEPSSDFSASVWNSIVEIQP